MKKLHFVKKDFKVEGYKPKTAGLESLPSGKVERYELEGMRRVFGRVSVIPSRLLPSYQKKGFVVTQVLHWPNKAGSTRTWDRKEISKSKIGARKLAAKWRKDILAHPEYLRPD